ncbi:MAG: PilZ domain-containing protein [Proteobacteria bacterium]|nr:PilZ domain-containing protein [Pseudomonadota bacterium]
MEKSGASWDDIPSLELEMEDSSKEEKNRDNRRHGRIDSNVLKGLLLENISFLPIRIATLNGVYDGNIENLSQSGIRFSVPNFIEKGEAVKLGFIINSRKITVKGIVIWVNNYESGSTGGLEFVDPDQKDVDFIASLIHASNFNKAVEVEESKKENNEDFPE